MKDDLTILREVLEAKENELWDLKREITYDYIIHYCKTYKDKNGNLVKSRAYEEANYISSVDIDNLIDKYYTSTPEVQYSECYYLKSSPKLKVLFKRYEHTFTLQSLCDFENVDTYTREYLKSSMISPLLKELDSSTTIALPKAKEELKKFLEDNYNVALDEKATVDIYSIRHFPIKHESTNIFTSALDSSQKECIAKDLQSEIKRIKDRIKELEFKNRGLYIGYINYVIKEPGQSSRECREYHVLGDMNILEAREAYVKLRKTHTGFPVESISEIKVEKLPEDIFNLFKIFQQLMRFKREIDRCTFLPEINNSDNITYEHLYNEESIRNYLKEEIKKVRTKLKTEMEARGMQFDSQANIY